MSIKKWFKDRMISVAIAVSNTEKNFLAQKSSSFSEPEKKVQDASKGTLAFDLKKGVVSTEVQNLRWRMYKIIKASESYKTKIIGEDENGNPIVVTDKSQNKSRGLKKVKVDNFDSYPIELVVDNSEITISVNDSMDKDNFTSTEYFALNKAEKPVNIIRKGISKFNIEDYTKKLNVRSINETEKLLEFCVSIYPDEFNRTSRLFISEIKKLVENSKFSDVLEIDEVYFITNKTLGANDFLEYKYDITSFDKIVEFNGYYIIKFKANITIDGNDILEVYKMDELEEKYKNKEVKKIKR